MSAADTQRQDRRIRYQHWLQTAAFLGAAAILATVLYTSTVVQRNRHVEEAAATAAVQTQTVAVQIQRSTAAVPQPTPTRDWQPFQSTPLPAASQPLWADNAAQVEELARWGRGVLYGVSWSPDGTLLAVGTTAGVYLLDAASLQEVGLLSSGGSASFPSSLTFSSDGAYLALELEDRVQLWQIADGTLAQTVETRGEESTAVAFSPAGGLLLAWLDPSGAFLVVWADGATTSLPLPHRSASTIGQSTSAVVALSPNGQLVAAGLPEGTIYVWQVADGSLVATLNNGTMAALAFSPNGRFLAASSSAGVRVWQVTVAALLYTLPGEGPGPVTLAFSPDGRTLLAAGRTMARLYGVDSGALVRELGSIGDSPTGAYPWGQISAQVAFSPDGQTLLLGTVAGELLLIRVADGALQQAWAGFTPPWSGQTLSADGRLLAARSSLDEALWLWDTTLAVPVRELRVPEHTANLGARAAFSPDGRLVAGAAAQWVYLWQTADGAAAGRLPPESDAIVDDPILTPANPAQCVAFSPDGRWLASGYRQGTLILWQMPAGTVRWMTLELDLPETETGWCNLAFSPGGQYLASSWFGSPVYLWQLPEGPLVRQLGAAPAWATVDLAFSPDGRLLAAWTGPTEVSLWSVGSGELQRTLAAQTEVGLTLAFSPDGSLLAGGTVEGAIYLWRVADGTVASVLEGHRSWVGGLAFSADERFLYSAAADGTVRVWGVR